MFAMKCRQWRFVLQPSFDSADRPRLFPYNAMRNALWKKKPHKPNQLIHHHSSQYCPTNANLFQAQKSIADKCSTHSWLCFDATRTSEFQLDKETWTQLHHDKAQRNCKWAIDETAHGKCKLPPCHPIFVSCRVAEHHPNSDRNRLRRMQQLQLKYQVSTLNLLE